MTRSRNSTKALGAEIIACFLKGPRTSAELMEMVPIGEGSLYGWLVAFQEAGVIRKARFRSDREPGKSGKSPVEYVLQNSPFEREDFAS